LLSRDIFDIITEGESKINGSKGFLLPLLLAEESSYE
jgi:hypothetical protein